MTPKEKATNLFITYYSKISALSEDYLFAHIKYINSEDSYVKISKQCALIAVNLKLEGMIEECGDPVTFWQQVRTEIENL